MADPTIVNRVPGEGEEMNPLSPIYFGVRDADYRTSLATVSALMTFSQQQYAAEELPQDERFFIDVFSDGIPIPRTGEIVDRALDNPPQGPVVTLTNQSSDTERGTLFFEEIATPRAPVGCEIRFTVQNFTLGAALPYQANTEYAGIMFGLVHWPSGSAVTVYLCDDGVTKYLEFASPSQDGSGTRSVAQRVDFDWSLNPTENDFRILWDVTPTTSKIYLFSTDEDSEETLLHSESTVGWPQLLTSARLGNRTREDETERVVAFVGIDGDRDIGETEIDVEKIVLEHHGEVLIRQGIETPRSSAVVSSNALTRVHVASDVASWLNLDATFVGDSDEVFNLQRLADSLDSSMVVLEETDLQAESFLILGKMQPQSSTHVGSFSTGMGFTAVDGTKEMSFRFIEKDTMEVGILTGTNRDIDTAYERAEMAWNDELPEILIVANSSDDYCHLYATDGDLLEEVTPLVSLAYADLPAASDTTPRLALGFVDTDGGVGLYDGFLVADSFTLLPRCIFYYPYDSGAVPSGDWTVTSSDGGHAYDAASKTWKIRPTAEGEHTFCSLTYTEQDLLVNETGLAVLMRVTVGDRKAYGQTNEPRIPSPALLAIDVGSGRFLQLQFVSDLPSSDPASRTFIFVSQDAQDYLEVLNPRSEVGQLISAPIDLSGERIILVAYRPRGGIQVFVDLEPDPIIDIPWGEKDVVARDDVAGVLTGTTVSVGSIPTLDAGNVMDVDVRLIAASRGSGHDFAVTLAVPEADLEDKIYGAQANVFIDVTDTD